MPADAKRRVAVLIESSRAYGRALIEGIGRYARQQAQWTIDFEPRGLEEGPPRWLRKWRGDGILVRVDHPAMAKAVMALGVPVIDLRGNLSVDGLPLIIVDNTAIGRLAYEHLADQGLKEFAFCGVPSALKLFSAERGEAFLAVAESHGRPCRIFEPRPRTIDREQDHAQLAAWLAELPKPVGILACFDDRAFELLELCRKLQLRVPEDVAVVGVDNDPVLCQMADPPLSSIDPDGNRVGYEAALRLDRWMQGDPPPQERLVIPPRGLVARRSSDALAIDEPDIAEAIRYVRTHACEGMLVEEILQHLPISRSMLERSFKKYLGRTPKAEILRLQILRARELLADRSLSLRDIARLTGFRSEKYFNDAFHRQTGERPGAFRRGLR